MKPKDLVFYFVRKVKKTFPYEWRKKLDRVYIHTPNDTMRLGRGGRETTGYYKRSSRTITIPVSEDFNLGSRDIYEGLKRIESIVEHELLHAVGLNHEQIGLYKQDREKYIKENNIK